METKKNIFEIAEQLLKRAETKLESSKLLLEKNFIDDALSRAYYAAFLAAKAALILVGEEPKTHTGTLTLFGLKLIKTGLLPKKLGYDLTDLFEKRQTSDYSVIVYYDEKDGLDGVKKAENIIREVKKFMKTVEDKQH